MIGIIDADLLVGNKHHRFPNLCSMKISAYYKEQGYEVKLLLDYKNLEQYEKVFISKVFTETYVPESVLKMNNVNYGGTGFFYDKAEPLPYQIEHHMPDYHLYDEWVQIQLNNGAKKISLKYYTDYSIGFTTRGCFRKCGFCVNQNYDRVYVHSPISEFYDPGRKKICLLDDNVFGCSEWKKIFEELKATKKPFQYKQGLDERLLTDEKCRMLFSCKYDGDYIFAFDNIEDKDLIVEKAKLIRKYYRKLGKHIKFYILCGYDKNNVYDNSFWVRDIENTMLRILLLAGFGFCSYVMKYEKYKESPYKNTYVVISQWANNQIFFFNWSLEDFSYTSSTKLKFLREYDVGYMQSIVPKNVRDLFLDRKIWSCY